MTQRTLSMMPIALALGLGLPACSRPDAATSATPAGGKVEPAPGGAVVATVDGAPITEDDVRQYLVANGAKTANVSAEQVKNVLEPIIRQELLSRRALELGLDRDPKYQRQLRQREAALKTFKRAELARRFADWEASQKTPVTEAEAREYFAAHEEQLSTRYHLLQLLVRQEGELEKIEQELKTGVPFETVAARQFKDLPASAGKPWDLGFLRWEQLPSEWHEILPTLAPGKTSGIIRSADHRFWIIKLVAKERDATVTFESTRPMLMTTLARLRKDERREKTEQDLRSRARVVYEQLSFGSGNEEE